MRNMVFRTSSLSLVLVCLLILAAVPASAQGNNLTATQIRNIFLQADGMGGGIQLEDGLGQEFKADGTTLVSHYEVMDPVALGDLNGDTLGDGAMVLQVVPVDGADVIYSLHVIVNDEGQPSRVAFAVLGSQLRVINLAIRDGQIVVDMLTTGENDPDCCAATPIRQIYQLQADGAFDLIEEQSFEDAGLPFALDNELTIDELANLTYPETLEHFALDLVDGNYSFDLDDNTFSYQLLDKTVYGDLTGDGLDDAVVFVQYSFNGEPAIQFMYVVMNDRGMPQIVGWRDYSRFVDVEITNVVIEGGVLTVDFHDIVHDNDVQESMMIEMEELVTQ